MILGILQARTSSTRLPSKVLLPVLGKPMLERQIERTVRSAQIDKLVLATSRDPSDDEVASVAASSGITCYRGSLNDVLDRFYHAALPFTPEYIVRMTGDCPLIDPTVIDETILFCLAGRYDYASNALVPSFPDGLDVEVFRFSSLEKAWREAKLPSQREHVTLYINQSSNLFTIGNYAHEGEDLSLFRLTVDEPEDLVLVRRIYEALYVTNPAFSMRDILELLRREPSLIEINARFQRNEGLRKSLAQDRQFIDRTK